MTLIKILAVYITFQEFILKWMPIDDVLYQLLRQVPDMLIFVLALSLFLRKFSMRGLIPIIGKKIDAPLWLFMLWAIFTLAVNLSADLFVGIANIKALLRYTLLVYILLILKPSEADIRSLLKWISIAVFVQVLVGMAQFFGGIPARDFLAARHVDVGIGALMTSFTGDRFEGVNDLMGTMGDNISFGYFLLMGLAIFLFSSRFQSVKYWFGITLIVTLIYLSGSRAITITAILFVIGHQAWVCGYKKITVRIALLAFALSPLGLVVIFGNISFSSDEKYSFLFMFNEEYLEGSLNSRLGIVVHILPKILLDFHNIIGFSPDKMVFAGFVSDELRMIPQILIDLLPIVLEDVYWVAMYVYFGLVGIVLWILFLYRLQGFVSIIARSDCATVIHPIAGAAFFLLWASLPLNLFNQAFEARSFAFYLWLYCGLCITYHKNRVAKDM